MNQTTTCVSSYHKQCMDSMFSRWSSSQNSHPSWKCISHAPDWKNSEQFSVSLNMKEKIFCPPVTFNRCNVDTTLTPASSNTLLKMIRPVFDESTQLYSTPLQWHHHARHGWEEKARECEQWSESCEECCAESHRNAATKSSYCTTTVLQGKPLHGKCYQTIPQDSPLPFKAPDHPVRLECHRTEIWLGCKIIYKAVLTIVAFQLCDSFGCLCRTIWLYSRLCVQGYWRY